MRYEAKRTDAQEPARWEIIETDTDLIVMIGEEAVVKVAAFALNAVAEGKFLSCSPELGAYREHEDYDGPLP